MMTSLLSLSKVDSDSKGEVGELGRKMYLKGYVSYCCNTLKSQDTFALMITLK